MLLQQRHDVMTTTIRLGASDLAQSETPSLFKWRSVSNIPIGELETDIDSMKANASKLQSPLSPDETTDLLACVHHFQRCIEKMENRRKRPARHVFGVPTQTGVHKRSHPHPLR